MITKVIKKYIKPGSLISKFLENWKKH